MEEFALFNKEISTSIEHLLNKNYLSQEKENKIKNYAIFSNEYVSERLRTLIHIDDLRVAGSFFTGDELAKEAIDRNVVASSSIILDPACGTGNLLLAASSYLCIKETLTETLEYWGNILWGLDLHQEFVESTKLRIISAIVGRGVIVDNKNLNFLLGLLPNIKKGNIYDNSLLISQVDTIIINPPFGIISKPDWCKWTTGKVNSAALFIEHCLNHLKKSTKIIAILPDVLRSGSRYKKWREILSSKLSIEINTNGIFDNNTDVNTFILKGIIGGTSKSNIWFCTNNHRITLSTICKVNVGPVVPYRDKEYGEIHKFIDSRTIESWKTIETSNLIKKRRFNGRTISPPFVLVKRNSRPDDKYRARATIIVGNDSIAVENHLIILEPFNKTISECNRIITILKAENTNKFLNERIRCRHLTVSSLKEIPIEGEYHEKNEA